MNETSNLPAVCPLPELGVLAFRGPDARAFLQGQLSNDVASLAGGTLVRAGLHTPQGRTLALLALLAGSADEVLAVLPRELIASTSATLQRYVLRARVRISDESASYHIHGLLPPRPGAPPGSGHVYEGERRLAIVPAGQSPPQGRSLTHTQWRALDIAAGLPQLYLPTSGQFVAQMLNLDCIGAISFQKGCYTGQEVIARAHYRGRVKRRMQRFLSAAALPLAPGQSGQLGDGRGFRVVEALARDDGRTEFLAVAPLPGAEPEPQSAGGRTGAPDTRVDAIALPLPYALPD